MSRPRNSFGGLRREHPLFFWGMVSLTALFLVGTVVVGSRIPGYLQEEARIEARMTVAERATRDALLASRDRRAELSLALLQRDARVRALEEDGIHLALDTEKGTLSLRHGAATLRTIPVQVGGDSTVLAPDGRTWRFVRPIGERRVAKREHAPEYVVPEWVYVSRGEPLPAPEDRTLARGLGTYVIRLNDGTEIYSEPPEGPLAGRVKPAAFMAEARELGAIFDAVEEDTPVFIY